MTVNEFSAGNRVKVLQVLDKLAIRGATMHGISRLMLTLLPAFSSTQIAQSMCVLRGEDGCSDQFSAAGISVEYLSRNKFDLLTVFDLIKIIRRDNIDILHCHGYGASTMGRVAGYFARVPVIVHEHMIDANMPWYQRIADVLLTRFTGHGIAVAEAVRVFMAGPRSIPDDRLSVVYNPVGPEFSLDAAFDAEGVARKYGIDLNRPVVGIVGRLDKVKGHVDFIRAAKLILEQRPDVQFLIVGDGELREDLERQVEVQGIQESVKFLGHCKEIIPILRTFTIAVNSSYSEGCCIALAEAMALSIPVVATDVGGTSEIVEHESSGLLVPSAAPDCLALAILRVLGDKALHARFSGNALLVSQRKFSLATSTQQLASIYQELMG